MKLSGVTLPRDTTRRATLLALWNRLEASPATATRVLWGAWAVTRLLLFVALLLGHTYSDPQFYNYAGKLAAGQWPYRDYPVEYPPLALLLILLPALPLLPFAAIAPRPDAAFAGVVTSFPHPNPLRYGAYGISFAVQMLLLDALTLWLVRRAALRFAPADRYGLRSGLLYIALVFASGALFQKFDLAAGLLCLVAVVATVERRDGLAWAALALATLLKGFPLLALPVLIGYQLYCSPRSGLLAALRDRAQPLLRGAAAFASVVLAWVLLIVLAGGGARLLGAIANQTARDTEIESLYGNIQLALGWLPGFGLHTAFSPPDLSRVVHSLLDPYANDVTRLALGLFLLVTYLGLWRVIRMQRGQDRTDGRQLLAIAVAAALLSFTLAFRALPAHYLLAVLPLAALIRLPAARTQRLWLLGLLVASLAGQCLANPGVWQALVRLQPWAVALLSLRNMAWILAYAALLVALWSWPRKIVHATGQG
ncbi:MAG: hypothetical protein OJF49_003692 [Ktedonobacterales bacterium]|jgi:hypothetical protein|nr:MAG: hypothetical protein OJF49_003692 [Ktedonobacterales bacterium]